MAVAVELIIFLIIYESNAGAESDGRLTEARLRAGDGRALDSSDLLDGRAPGVGVFCGVICRLASWSSLLSSGVRRHADEKKLLPTQLYIIFAVHAVPNGTRCAV